MTTDTKASLDGLVLLLRALKLPTVARCWEDIARTAEREGWSFGQYLHHLVELEVQERKLRRIERLQRASDLPAEKTLATLDKNMLPAKVQKLLPTLCDGDFVDRGDNVLAFGLPGRGKTHLVCAIGHELVRRGRRVVHAHVLARAEATRREARSPARERPRRARRLRRRHPR